MGFKRTSLISLTLAAGCQPVVPDAARVTVPASEVRIVDGDTVRYDGQAVRLIGWDSPEPMTGYKCEAERVWGIKATQAAEAALARAETVSFVFKGEDRYGRALAHYAFDGVNVGELLQAKGMAQRWDYDGGQRKPRWCD